MDSGLALRSDAPRQASRRHYTPNATSLDCITVNNALSQGWKAARSRHPGGANVLFGDGSVHVAKSSIDGATWAAAGTRAGGEANAFPF
jgi:prepilin-type processing-associated H-X9-DG protein